MSGMSWRLNIINKCKIKFLVLSICNNCYERRHEDVVGQTLNKNLMQDFKFSATIYYNLPENPDTIRNFIDHVSYEMKADVILLIGGPGFLKHVTPVINFHTADHVYEHPTMVLYGIIEKLLIAQGLICGIVNETITVNFPRGNENLKDQYEVVRSAVPVMQEILCLANTFLLSMDSAKILIKLVFHAYSVRAIITIPTITALSHLSAEVVRSDHSHPPRDESLKNGFAFKHNYYYRKRIISKVDLDDRQDRCLAPDECIYIRSGEPLVGGADCVVEFKNTLRIPKDELNITDIIQLLIPTQEYLNVKRAGEDIAQNEIVIKRGSVIHAEQLALLVKMGKFEVDVFGKPNVGIVSVVNRWSKERLEHIVADSSNAIIKIYFEKHNVMCTDYGILFGNKPETIRQYLIESDIIVINHNSMMGDQDDTIELLKSKFDAKFYFTRIGLNPSVAFAYCTINDEKKYVFILSGNPLSMLMICQTLIITSIKYWMGKNEYEQRQMNVMMKEDIELTNEPRYLSAIIEYNAACDCPVAYLKDQENSTGVEAILEIPAESPQFKVIKAGTELCAYIIE